MPHIGCGADILRMRREKAAQQKRLEELGLIPPGSGGEFKRAKNPQFPHITAARDPQVFNSKKCSFNKASKLPRQQNVNHNDGIKEPRLQLERAQSPKVPEISSAADRRRLFRGTKYASTGTSRASDWPASEPNSPRGNDVVVPGPSYGIVKKKLVRQSNIANEEGAQVSHSSEYVPAGVLRGQFRVKASRSMGFQPEASVKRSKSMGSSPFLHRLCKKCSIQVSGLNLTSNFSLMSLQSRLKASLTSTSSAFSDRKADLLQSNNNSGNPGHDRKAGFVRKKSKSFEADELSRRGHDQGHGGSWHRVTAAIHHCGGSEPGLGTSNASFRGGRAPKVMRGAWLSRQTLFGRSSLVRASSPQLYGSYGKPGPGHAHVGQPGVNRPRRRLVILDKQYRLRPGPPPDIADDNSFDSGGFVRPSMTRTTTLNFPFVAKAGSSAPSGEFEHKARGFLGKSFMNVVSQSSAIVKMHRPDEEGGIGPDANLSLSEQGSKSFLGREGPLDKSTSVKDVPQSPYVKDCQPASLKRVSIVEASGGDESRPPGLLRASNSGSSRRSQDDEHDISGEEKDVLLAAAKAVALKRQDSQATTGGRAQSCCRLKARRGDTLRRQQSAEILDVMDLSRRRPSETAFNDREEEVGDANSASTTSADAQKKTRPQFLRQLTMDNSQLMLSEKTATKASPEKDQDLVENEEAVLLKAFQARYPFRCSTSIKTTDKAEACPANIVNNDEFDLKGEISITSGNNPPVVELGGGQLKARSPRCPLIKAETFDCADLAESLEGVEMTVHGDHHPRTLRMNDFKTSLHLAPPSVVEYMDGVPSPVKELAVRQSGTDDRHRLCANMTCLRPSPRRRMSKTNVKGICDSCHLAYEDLSLYSDVDLISLVEIEELDEHH